MEIYDNYKFFILLEFREFSFDYFIGKINFFWLYMYGYFVYVKFYD